MSGATRKRGASSAAEARAARDPTTAQMVLRGSAPRRLAPPSQNRDAMDNALLEHFPPDLHSLFRAYDGRRVAEPAEGHPLLTEHLPSALAALTSYYATEAATRLVVAPGVELLLFPREGDPEEKTEPALTVILKRNNEHLVAFEANRADHSTAMYGEHVTLYRTTQDAETGFDVVEAKLFVMHNGRIGWRDFANATHGSIFSSYYAAFYDMFQSNYGVHALPPPGPIAMTLDSSPADIPATPHRAAEHVFHRFHCSLSMVDNAVTVAFSLPFQILVNTGTIYLPSTLRPPNADETWCDPDHDLVLGPQEQRKGVSASLAFCMRPTETFLVLRVVMEPQTVHERRYPYVDRRATLAFLRQLQRMPYAFRNTSAL